MKRLYYIADDLPTTKSVSDALHAAGISDWNFHVIAKDEAGLYRHQIHSAATYQELDVLHTGSRWAIAGALIGLGVAVGGVTLQLWPMHWLIIIALPFVFACFGAWQGGMVGLSRESYKIAPFHAQIDKGKYLLLVDVRRAQENDVRELIANRFPQLQGGGTDSTFINPLTRPSVIHHQVTH